MKKKRGRGSSSSSSDDAKAAPTTKQILHNVGGEAPAGAVTAIMGPTGARLNMYGRWDRLFLG